MPSKLECLELIRAARASATDPESAYVLRNRILRAVLAACHMCAERVGQVAPYTPQQITGLKIDSDPEATVISAANQVMSMARHLCQPSEALDTRWRSGWEEMAPALEQLEAMVSDLVIEPRV